MRRIGTILLAAFTIVGVGLFILRISSGDFANNVDFDDPNASVLIGCYTRGDTYIELTPERALFKNGHINIKYKIRKGLGRVILFEDGYPWFDDKKDAFIVTDLKRFDIANVIESDGRIFLKFWDSSYLRAEKVSDLHAVEFERNLLEKCS